MIFFFFFWINGWNQNEWTNQWWVTCVFRVTALQFLLNENFQVKRRNPLIRENFSSCKRQEYSIPSISILLQLILFSCGNSFTSVCPLFDMFIMSMCSYLSFIRRTHGTQRGNGYSAIRNSSRPDLARTQLYANSSSASSTSSCDSELESLLTPTDNSVVSRLTGRVLPLAWAPPITEQDCIVSAFCPRFHLYLLSVLKRKMYTFQMISGSIDFQVWFW